MGKDPVKPLWHDLGPLKDFKKNDGPREFVVGHLKLAVTYKDGKFGAVSGVCNHAGGPLGKGQLEGEYIVCPWHHWKFHFQTGKGEPGYEEDAVPQHEIKIENGNLWVNLTPATKRTKKPHASHPLARSVSRIEGAIRVAGISTTVMDNAYPRFSTSEYLLGKALQYAQGTLKCETQLIKLSELKFRACEGYYSKAARACTWPCSITQMDPEDQMDRVYESLVHWADVLVIATPIRWGSASSLYFKMIERLNCIQNQITIANKYLIKNKTVVFIVTGGQDNIQAVVGQQLALFSGLGFVFPQYPFIAHSRGWTAEDMEKNVVTVMKSMELEEGSHALVGRAVEMAERLLNAKATETKMVRGGRKANPLAKDAGTLD